MRAAVVKQLTLPSIYLLHPTLIYINFVSMRHKHLNISYLRVIYAQLLRHLEIRANSIFGQTQSFCFCTS